MQAPFREWVRLMDGKSDHLLEDAVMATTARVHGLKVATRNENDFDLFRQAWLQNKICLVDVLGYSSSAGSNLTLRSFMWIEVSVILRAFAMHGQSDLNGVFDIHVHFDPDSLPRPIDAMDLVRSPNRRECVG